MKIALLGYGVQAKAAYDYWNKPENTITVCDINENIEIPVGVAKQSGPKYLDNLEEFDLLIRISSLHSRDLIEATKDHPEVLNRITTVTNEFLKVCPTKNVIGITGTKGKGTTSTLVAKMLEADGCQVHLGGNIGTPPLDLLKDPIKADDWVVLELANFQLIDLKYSPHIAVCLMVVPEHLDWHTNIEEYVMAKQQMFRWQNPEDIAIYYADNQLSTEVVSISKGKKIPFMKPPGAYIKNDAVVIDDQVICNVNEIKLLGKHNWQNVCAAITTAWQITQNVESIRSVIASFTGLEHRLEFVKEIGGIKYYNDSFAATPDAASAAIEAIPGKKVLIAGGFERNLPLENFAQSVADNTQTIRKVVLVGTSAQRIATALNKVNFTNYLVSTDKKMATIVKQAREFTEPGDSVVLSPGFASFDMFKNFEDRGNQFKQAVNAI